MFDQHNSKNISFQQDSDIELINALRNSPLMCNSRSTKQLM